MALPCEIIIKILQGMIPTANYQKKLSCDLEWRVEENILIGTYIKNHLSDNEKSYLANDVSKKLYFPFLSIELDPRQNEIYVHKLTLLSSHPFNDLLILLGGEENIRKLYALGLQQDVDKKTRLHYLQTELTKLEEETLATQQKTDLTTILYSLLDVAKPALNTPATIALESKQASRNVMPTTIVTRASHFGASGLSVFSVDSQKKSDKPWYAALYCCDDSSNAESQHDNSGSYVALSGGN